MDSKIQNIRQKNLFVVDWKNTKIETIQKLLDDTRADKYEWSVFNCFAKKYLGNGIINRYISYFAAAIFIIKNRKKYDNIIIWQQIIGFIFCLFPKYYSKPRIIITTILYSPNRVNKGSFRLYLLKNALKKADALVYFSTDMAENVRLTYQNYASKVFSTFLPITDDPGVAFYEEGIEKNSSIFTGGFSDRDFETVIRAFTNTNIAVTIVCTKAYSFKDPNLITNNFTVKRNVSEIEYFKLVLASQFVVVPLENEYSSCGQILLTFCMKNSIPIIASDCYGTRDYIINLENGILVPVKDEKAIFSSYQQLIGDSAFKQKLIDRSLEISSKMTFSNFLNKIDSIIQKNKII